MDGQTCADRQTLLQRCEDASKNVACLNRTLTNTLTHNTTLPMGKKSSMCPKSFLGFEWIQKEWDGFINGMVDIWLGGRKAAEQR